MLLFVCCTICATSCTRGTVNVSGLGPGDIQNEHGWRYYTVAFPADGAVESLALCESNGLPFVAWRVVRVIEPGVRTKIFTTFPTDTSARVWVDPTNIWKNIGDDPYYASDLALIDLAGTPAICFYGSTQQIGSDNALLFMRSASADHTLWSSAATIAATGSAQFGCNMLGIAGSPAIQFVETVPGTADQRHSVYFMRAGDTLGASWPAPTLVHRGLWSGEARPSLALVSGHPAICFAGRHSVGIGTTPQAASNLSYVRALDELGASWSSPIILDLTPGAGEVAELAQIGSHPSVYYRVEPDSEHPAAAHELRYLPALDATGFTWGTPRFLGIGNGWQVVDIGGRAFASNGVVPQQSQLAGTPYLTGRISVDDRGEQWSDEHFLDYTQQVGVHDLTIISGRPAIAYLEGGRIVYATFHF